MSKNTILSHLFGGRWSENKNLEIIRISIIKKMAQYQDERGFTKTEMEVWNPNQEGANFQATGR